MTRIIEVTHIGEDYATIKVKGTAGEFQTSRGLGEAIIKAYEREERQAQKGARYTIVRYYAKEGKRPRVIRKGVTLEEAREHCNDPKTRKAGVWFDGYTDTWE